MDRRSDPASTASVRGLSAPVAQYWAASTDAVSGGEHRAPVGTGARFASSVAIMAKPFSDWTVLPHGQLMHLEDDVVSVTGFLQMPPMGQVQRRMTIVRLNDRRLVVYSAIALAETEMTEIEAFGTPAYLIVPNAIHRMDVKAWKERYPAMKVVAPKAARARVDEVVPVDLTEVHFADPNVQLITVPGTGEREFALLVHSGSGTTLIVNDLIFNLHNRPGVSGWIFKIIGMTGDEPRLPAPIRMRQVVDKRALKEQFVRWSQMPDLKRIVIAHGDIIADNPGPVLRRIADDLVA
jgi:hypothetical protein